MPVDVQVPNLGESITQAVLLSWRKADGQAVSADEPICELETDKANADLPAPAAGVLRHLVQAGQTVTVGQAIARIDTDGAAGKSPAPAAARQSPTAGIPSPAAASSAPAEPAALAAAAITTPEDDLSPAVRRLIAEHQLDPTAVKATGPGGRLTKEDVLNHLARRPAPPPPAAATEDPTPAAVIAPTPPLATPTPATAAPADQHGQRRVPMSKIRRRIAENLVRAHQTAAILTTFNEIDMSAILDLRSRYKERFEQIHGVGLGFMSFFARAVAMALKETPALNARIDGDDIVYHDPVHLGIAVSTDRGLAVPVLRNVQNLSLARIEAEIKRMANDVRDGRLSVEELSGGTFTITNGGVFGSLLSTPILNPPQSGILGMHAIEKRPVAVNDQVVIRPMMYVALSYDHRLVDGRDAVVFLVRVKQLLEDPARMMLEI